ncbi:MAG: PD-(D/E)XK nuclease domain-containing protein, partial [Cetobacterium sp.]
DVKKWYNGYKFGNSFVYNPWSIINFISKNKLESYWINTSDNALIKQLLSKNDSKVIDDLKSVFSGNQIEEVITENIIFSDLENPDTIWSLMLFAGYLTYDKFKISTITGVKTYFLKIPNYEVQTFFRNIIDLILHKNSIKARAKEALAQIDEKKYDISMKNNGVSKIIKIGMAFSGKDVAIESNIK